MVWVSLVAGSRNAFKRAWEKNVEETERLGLDPGIEKVRAAVFPKLKKRLRKLVRY